MSTWQPIETAPRDGTRVLTYREGFAEDMAVAWYSTEWRVWYAVHDGSWPKPTHWMPKPEKP